MLTDTTTTSSSDKDADQTLPDLKGCGIHLPENCFVVLIKYMDLQELVLKIMRLNKRVRDIVQAENYLLFKHFLRNFNMFNERLKRSEIPALTSIHDLLRENFLLRKSAMQDLQPYGFFTDGGTYNDDSKYFINNIFSASGVCYSTKVPTNTNV